MTQSKTSLILNNLVELTIPTCTDSKYLHVTESPQSMFPASQAGKNASFLSVKLQFPFTFLLQKVCLEESNKTYAEPFNIEMITKHAVTHGPIRSALHETEIIDFKKNKIDWRFKTRMRSNSNEFLESPLAFMQKNQEDQQTSAYLQATKMNGSKQERTDSEDLSILSSDEEVALKQDGHLVVLGQGISNQFTLYLGCSAATSTVSKDDDSSIQSPTSKLDDATKGGRPSRITDKFCLAFSSIKLFVWPTFRLPTGSSVIALINTSFLFDSKRLEQERLEADFLVALSLISGRKFIQASEKLRKIQSHLLSKNISVKSLLQAMNIEMIIGESMNQHSQISEKMFAFHRAVHFYRLAKRVEKNQDDHGGVGDVDQLLNSTRNKTRLKQEEAYKYLLRLQPYLVEVLLINIDSHVQAVRMASLKTLEFLFDTLGCNLDESLISILIAIIKTYPSMTKRSNLPKDGKVISFFEDSWQLGGDSTDAAASGRRGSQTSSHDDTTIQAPPVGSSNLTTKSNLHRFRPDSLGEMASQHSTFFSLNDIHSLKDCQVKDASLFHQSFIQTSKNFYNHILESMVFLISSTSTPILVRIFNEVIQKVLFQESIEQDLQIYLLRLSDRILQLCQGYVHVINPFLNTLFELILSRNSLEAQGTANRNSVDDQMAKVVNDLWHTLKSSYLLNQSGEGISAFITWVVNQFNMLTEKVTGASTSGSSNRDSSDFTNSYMPRSQAQLRDVTMSVIDQQKLLLLLDLTNLLIFGHLKSQKRMASQFQKDRKNEKRNLKKLAEREIGVSFNSDAGNVVGPESQANREQNPHGGSRRPRSSMKLISLEMCQLIDPVIFWLNFSIEKPDRLNFFKVIWSTLTKLVQVVPKKRQIGVEFDCIQIILPTLQRVENFCKTSSPSLEMLQFLIVVFSDIKGVLLETARKRTKRDLFSFLKSFLVTFSQNIPHNLHDEVFEVCSLLIDLVGTNGFLTQSHVKEVLEALVHKFTMRSKAHKRLSDQFLRKWVLDQSLIQFEELKKVEFQLVDEQLKLQQQQLQATAAATMTRPRTYSNNQVWSRHPLHPLAQHQQQPPPQQYNSYGVSPPMNNNASAAINVNTGGVGVSALNIHGVAANSDDANEISLTQQPQQQIRTNIGGGHWTTTNNNNQSADADQQQVMVDNLSQSDDFEENNNLINFGGGFQQQQQQPEPIQQQIMSQQAAPGSQGSQHDQPLHQQPHQPQQPNGVVGEIHGFAQPLIHMPQRAYSQPSNIVQHVNNNNNQAVVINMMGVTAENDSTQAIENGSNRVPLIEHKMFNMAAAAAGVNASQQKSLYFDTLCDFCLFNNFLPLSDQFVSEQDQEQIYFEKLSLIQDVIEASKEAHNSLFKRLLHHADFSHKIAAIFTYDRARAKIIKLMKSMTAFFLKFNSPKTFYEHPIVQTSALPINNPLSQPQPQPQVSARYQANVVERGPGSHSQLQFGGQQLHSEPSMDLLHMMNQEDNNDITNNVHGGNGFRDGGNRDHQTSANEQIREQDLNLRRLNHHYSQYVERQQNNFLFNFGQNEAIEGESPALAPSNVNMFLFDEVNLINNERLILIKTFTILIRIQTEELQVTQEIVSKDSQSQLQALNMIDMLLFSLCPVPSFQNVVIRNLLSPDSGGHHTGGGQANNGSEDFSYQIAHPHRLSFQFTGLNSMFGSQLGISNQDQQHNDAIPDFETMLICEKQPQGLSETQPPVEPNSFPKEFECWDIRYQHSRLALAFKFWPFVEDAMLNSSWNNVKAACYSVLCKAVQVLDVTLMSANYQKRLKDLLFPLLNKLLKSQESEGRAAGLNILGSFCGLSNLQGQNYRQSLEFSREDDDSSFGSSSRQDAVFDSDQGQDYDYDRYEQRQREALTRNQIKVREHLHVFRRNSSFVSLAIWQEVFDLQENWNQQIRDAAEVLTQLCAPKDSVKHFKKMSDEKFSLRVSEAQKQLKHLQTNGIFKPLTATTTTSTNNKVRGSFGVVQKNTSGLPSSGRQQFNSQSVFNGLKGNEIFPKQSSQQKLMSAHAGGNNHVQSNGAINYQVTGVQFNQDFNMLTDGSLPQNNKPLNSHHQSQDLLNPQQQPQMQHQQNQQQQRQLNSNEGDDHMIEHASLESSSDEDDGDDTVLTDESELFFMEHLPEKQLQQAISLFNAEFRPISGLWIDRTAQTSRVKSNKLNRLNFNGGGGLGSVFGSSQAGQDDDYSYNDQQAGLAPQSNLLIDFFEDNMLEEVASIDSKEDDIQDKATGSKDTNQAASSDRHQTTSQSDGEDLGIIDLDKQEGSEYDDFDQLDDEKLPVLKNTYSKKNRPNNSKSVAIGSRSQGDVLRIRSQALQVLKAADEEIQVQIQEHSEMLSGLQLSFASHKSHEKKFKTDLLEERKRWQDDGSLNRQENHEWLSSLSESADRIYKKRRIQSGKAQSYLSEDYQITDRQHSQYSKTSSSNASHSTPMEIGDIQIIMHQEAKQSQQQQNPQQYRIMCDREKVVQGFHHNYGEGYEIRSQQDNTKQKQRQARRRQQRSMQKGDLLSEYNNDTNDKVSDPDDREEVISAPIKGTIDTRGGKKQSLAYRLSDGSLTELSSPFGDENSSSTKTVEENEGTKRKPVKVAKQQTLSKGAQDQTQKNSAAKKSQQPYGNASTHNRVGNMQQPSLGTSNYLQSVVSKQTLTSSQLHQSSVATFSARPSSHSTTSNKLQTTQGKYINKDSSATATGGGQGRSGSGKQHLTQVASQNHTSSYKSTSLGQSSQQLKQPYQNSNHQSKHQNAEKGGGHQLGGEDGLSTRVSTSAALQKPVLGSTQSQSVMLVNSQKAASLTTKQSSSKQKHVLTRTSRNGAAVAQGGIKQDFSTSGKDSVASAKQRPQSLVLRHMPHQNQASLATTKPVMKRNNFISQQQPHQQVSPRNSKKDGGQSQRSVKQRRGTTGEKQRQTKQADILKYSKPQPPPQSTPVMAEQPTSKYVDDVDNSDELRFPGPTAMTPKGAIEPNSRNIDDSEEEEEEDPVEDLI